MMRFVAHRGSAKRYHHRRFDFVWLFFHAGASAKRLAGLLLLISFVLVNLIPSNPYFLSTIQTMSQGKC